MKRITITVLITLFVLLSIPVVMIAGGVVNLSASKDPGWLERSVGSWAVERSVAVRAPDTGNPFAGDEEAISTGRKNYKDMCARCHGGPDKERDEFAKGLNPPAPDIEHVAEEFSSGDLFWITKHGIRMTGMPAFGKTHDDDELWKIVAYVKTIPTQPERPAEPSDPEDADSVANGASHSHDNHKAK